MIVILVDTKGRARTGDAVTENLYARIRELEAEAVRLAAQVEHEASRNKLFYGQGYLNAQAQGVARPGGLLAYLGQYQGGSRPCGCRHDQACGHRSVGFIV